MLAVLGGSATVGLAGCSALIDDGNGEDGNGDGNGDGWEDLETSENADKAQAAWERVLENTAPEEEDVRNEAYIEIEEAVRDDMVILPLYHELEEIFSYDYVDAPETGSLGFWMQQHNRTELTNGDDELTLLNSSFDELDPIMSTDTASGRVINQIYEKLTHYTNGTDEVENQLLEDFTLSDDGLTYTFEIKEGVQFHDGRELTADDIKYSWRRMAESEYSERQTFMIATPNGLGIEYEESDDGGIEPDSIAVDVIDDYTFEVTLREPNPKTIEILTYSAFAAIPEGLVGDIEGYDGEIDHGEFQTDTAIGTGPFQYEEFNPGEDMVVSRFDDYHGETASVETIRWLEIEDAEAQWTNIVEGNLDIFDIPTPQYDPDLIDAEEDEAGNRSGEYGPIENDEVLNYSAAPQTSIYYFGFNVTNVPRPVRRAIAYVTDHEELIEEVFSERGSPAYSFTPPGLWPTGEEGYEQWVDEWPYGVNETDTESAADELEEAGFTEDDPFELTANTYASAPEYADLADLIRQKLSGLGVEIQIEETQFSTLQDRGEDGDLEMYSLGWTWSWVDPAYGHYGFEPKLTNTSEMPENGGSYYLDWHTNLDEEA
ncbi:ABC transporter substrate-binding protein [Halopiger goleimassiliensis]|uniref:ABC transporter substrate-binding protein n=1 Tax=Halopiger goleimassiliensis TaxID=1293048 RepID=UPI000677BAD7|nr:ABC transporter substrate-binding protein [Halopiger goleimassiliensis]